jgi:hypothetical protein
MIAKMGASARPQLVPQNPVQIAVERVRITAETVISSLRDAMFHAYPELGIDRIDVILEDVVRKL